MVQRVRMKALNVDGQYEQVYPQTTADQVIIDATTNQTLADKLDNGTIGAANSKGTIINQVIVATTANQTVFPFDMSGMNVTKASLTVHLNGEFLHEDEYTLNTSQIVLSGGVSVGDKLHISINTGIVEQSSSSTSVVTDIVNSSGQTDMVGTLNSIKQESVSAKQSVVQSLKNVDGSLTVTSNSSWSDIVSQIGNIDAGIVINGVIEQYKVQAGETISAGDFVEFVNTNGTMSAGSPTVFNSASTHYISAVTLNENKVLVSYRDNGNGYYGTAVVLTINDMSITKGSPVVFESASVDYISAVKLSENKVLVSYRDNGNSGYGTAIVLTINGTSITKGSPIVFESGSTTHISAVSLNENKVLVSYRDGGNSGYGTAIVLTINESSITAGSPIVFESASVDYISAVSLNENKVLVSYRDIGNSNYGTAIVLTINGTSITKGSPIVFNSDSASYISAVTLNENKVLVSYRDNGNSHYGTAIVLTINGTTITTGSPIVFESASTEYISAVKLNENKVLVSYADYGNSGYGTAIVLTINGTSITKGSPIVFNSASTYYISAVVLNENKVLVSYTDDGNSAYGTATTINISGDETSIKKSTSKQTIHGVAQATGAAGQTIPVITI